MRCKYNDSGWCYAESSVDSNAINGECREPCKCPYRSQKRHEERAETWEVMNDSREETK